MYGCSGDFGLSGNFGGDDEDLDGLPAVLDLSREEAQRVVVGVESDVIDGSGIKR